MFWKKLNKKNLYFNFVHYTSIICMHMHKCCWWIVSYTITILHWNQQISSITHEPAPTAEAAAIAQVGTSLTFGLESG